MGGGGGGYGKDNVPANATIISAKIPIEKIIPSDDSIKDPLDFVAEAAKIEESKQLEVTLLQRDSIFRAFSRFLRRVAIFPSQPYM